MKRLIIIPLVLGWVALSCTTQSLQTTYDKQTTTIESFISARMKADETATLTRNGGAYRLTLHDTMDPTRDSLDYGETVKFDYAMYILSGSSINKSNLVATSKASVSESAGWDLTDKEQFGTVTRVLDDSLIPGLRDGLWGVQPGDEAYILFNGKYGYGNTAMGTVPAMSALVFQVWIESIE